MEPPQGEKRRSEKERKKERKRRRKRKGGAALFCSEVTLKLIDVTHS
jgi:hypothetical protein